MQALLFWRSVSNGLLWTLHCARGCTMTLQWYERLLCHGMRADLRVNLATPTATWSYGRRSIEYAYDFNAIPCIFVWNKSIFKMFEWVRSLRYSANARAFGPRIAYGGLSSLGLDKRRHARITLGNTKWRFRMSREFYGHFGSQLFTCQRLSSAWRDLSAVNPSQICVYHFGDWNFQYIINFVYR